jgi:hypothetical protein
LTFSLIGALVLASGAFGQSYVRVLDGYATFPLSINKQGEIAGFGVDGNLSPFGFVRAADGTLTGFRVPGFAPTYAFSINDAGAITGYYLGPPFPFITNHGYVRDPEGNFTMFDPQGSTNTQALSINAGGAITGYYNESNLVNHGFVREPNGKITSFDPSDSISTKAVSINANGTITGDYQVADLSVHGFVRRPGGMIVSFDPPESTGTTVTAINNAGAITGYYTVADGRTFGFVRRAGGKIESFDVPGILIGVGSLPYNFVRGNLSINDEGTITGSYSDNGGTHGFVRSPEGIITSFDPPSEPGGVPTSCLASPLGPATYSMSINQEGVITGWCHIGSPGTYSIGWVRYP